jgi:DNA mismatch endonuclease (patch repair protein)
MSDVHDKLTRSYNMSQIKSKNTKPELLVRKFLFSKGFRYKLHDKNLSGKPDIVLPRLKIVIFIHGCFWHGHTNCKYMVMPKTRKAFWENKIFGNRDKDIRNLRALKKLGWRIITVWECQLKPAKVDQTLARLAEKLVDKNKY